MIIIQQLDENTVLHYSDAGLKIRQIETGGLFDEAGDLIPCAYTYEETDIPIDPTVEPDEEIDWETAMRIIMGEV